MTEQFYFPVPDGFYIQLTGSDAAAVVNNLSTNEIAKLDVGASCETIVTNLRGWVVGHACVYRGVQTLTLLGQHPQPQVICDHIDRYIIREDAEIENLSAEFDLWVTPQLLPQDMVEQAGAIDVPCRIIQGCRLVAVAKENSQAVKQLWQSQGLSEGSREDFEWLRIAAFWPATDHEIVDKTLPQELDRDAVAISFTKGCYLGQETIARLDARGQLQKKICLLELQDCPQAEVGTPLEQDNKQVGQLTSVAERDGRRLALGQLKRGYFDAGTQIACSTGQAIVQPVDLSLLIQ